MEMHWIGTFDGINVFVVLLHAASVQFVPAVQRDESFGQIGWNLAVSAASQKTSKKTAVISVEAILKRLILDRPGREGAAFMQGQD